LMRLCRDCNIHLLSCMTCYYRRSDICGTIYQHFTYYDSKARCPPRPYIAACLIAVSLSASSRRNSNSHSPYPESGASFIGSPSVPCIQMQNTNQHSSMQSDEFRLLTIDSSTGIVADETHTWRMTVWGMSGCTPKTAQIFQTYTRAG